MAGNHWNRLKTSGAFACRIRSFQLGLLPELDPRSCSYFSSHPERCCRFPALDPAAGGGCRAGDHRIDSETSDASACRMQRSEL
eukprot:8438840-Pyramimonas_sp.AAC.1